MFSSCIEKKCLLHIQPVYKQRGSMVPPLCHFTKATVELKLVLLLMVSVQQIAAQTFTPRQTLE